jgi:hypothetical protein
VTSFCSEHLTLVIANRGRNHGDGRATAEHQIEIIETTETAAPGLGSGSPRDATLVSGVEGRIPAFC